MTDVNEITLFGHLGKDAEIRNTQGGQEVATFTVATDSGWKDKDTGEWKKNVTWHNIVTFQTGLISMIKAKGKKGARVFVKGEQTYRSWRKEGEATDRQQCEVKIGPGGTLIFEDGGKADRA